MTKNRLTLKIFLLIFINEIVDITAQTLMKLGLPHETPGVLNAGSLLEFARRAASSALVWMGILIYTGNFCIWIAVLSRLDLTMAVPLTSINYVLLPFFAIAVLHEKMVLMRWLGVLFIVCGVYFVSRSAVSKGGASA